VMGVDVGTGHADGAPDATVAHVGRQLHGRLRRADGSRNAPGVKLADLTSRKCPSASEHLSSVVRLTFYNTYIHMYMHMWVRKKTYSKRINLSYAGLPDCIFLVLCLFP
jgi:hypothetical protein